jgi:hypothetical protein
MSGMDRAKLKNWEINRETRKIRKKYEKCVAV